MEPPEYPATKYCTRRDPKASGSARPAFGSVRDTHTGLFSGVLLSRMCRSELLGMSLTKIHFTLKMPFHLSVAQTVLLVW